MENDTHNPFEEALTTGYYEKSFEHDSTKTLKIEKPVEVHPYVENLLNTLSYILLVIGGISFIVFFILAGIPQGLLDDWFEKFNWVTFSIGLGTALTQTVFFAILQVLRNISIKLNK